MTDLRCGQLRNGQEQHSRVFEDYLTILSFCMVATCSYSLSNRKASQLPAQSCYVYKTTMRAEPRILIAVELLFVHLSLYTFCSFLDLPLKGSLEGFLKSVLTHG